MRKQKHTRNLRHISPLIIPLNLSILKHAQTKLSSHEQSSVDFHVDMVQKIDQLIKEHPVFDLDSIEQHRTINFVDEPKIEPRHDLNKKLEISHPTQTETNVQHAEPERIESHPDLRPHTPLIPDEFKTDFPSTSNLEFRFIDSFPEKKEILRFVDTPSKHVEIVNLKSFMLNEKDASSQRSSLQRKQELPQKPKQKPSDFLRNSRIEVIPLSQSNILGTQLFQCSTVAAQESEENAQLFYVSSKKISEKQLKKLEVEQSYIPVNLEEKAYHLKEQEIKDIQEQNTHKQEKQTKEEKRQQKLDAKKKQIEEKKRKKEAKLLEKQQAKQEKKQTKTTGKKHEASKKDKAEKKGLWKKHSEETVEEFDEDLIKVLLMTDELLGKLPEKVIDEFSQSKEFTLYEKVLSKYKK
jgi:hypothetical protein